MPSSSSRRAKRSACTSACQRHSVDEREVNHRTRPSASRTRSLTGLRCPWSVQPRCAFEPDFLLPRCNPDVRAPRRRGVAHNRSPTACSRHSRKSAPLPLACALREQHLLQSLFQNPLVPTRPFNLAMVPLSVKSLHERQRAGASTKESAKTRAIPIT
jgi:hypothetical protein